MAFDGKEIIYLDGKFDKVFEKIDDNRKEAANDLEKHVDKDHRGVIGKTIIIISASVLGIGGLLTLLIVYLKGAL